MATKKPAGSKSKPKAPEKSQLQNLAARPASFDDTIDDQLVDASGVFRVTSAIAQAQTGHGEEVSRFPNDSLVMAAQRAGFPEDGPEELAEEVVVDDEATASAKRERLATLAARHRAQQNPRRR
jgi:hypothetical protein